MTSVGSGKFPIMFPIQTNTKTTESMSEKAHQVLDVAIGATEAEVCRAYRKAIARIEADTSLTDAQRKLANAQLDDAFRDLTSPVGGQAGGIAALISPTVIAVVLGIAVAGGGLAWYWKAEQARQAEERDRVLTEQREQERAREIAQRMERDKQRLQEEIRAQKEAEEAAHKNQIEMQQQEMKTKQFVEDTRPELRAPTRSTQFGDYAAQQQAWQYERDARARQTQEDRQRYEDERATARARAETERQKRYLEDRIREEELARLRRDAAARGIR
jgi:hypothetical protein